MRSSDIGHLVTVQAIATRVSDVKPLITVATYTCDVCGYEIYQNVSTGMREGAAALCSSGHRARLLLTDVYLPSHGCKLSLALAVFIVSRR